MSDAPAADAKEKPKSKKMIIIGGAVALLLIVGGGAGWFVMSKKAAADEEGGDEKPAAAAAPSHDAHKNPPTYLPLENMVVNLADAGGERFVQLGVTFEISDPKAADQVKAYLPAIRNQILILVSQTSSEDLLKREGKEKLATEILNESSRILGYDPDEEEETPKKKKKKVRKPESPLTAVLFANFIVQ
ncbi:flagellar basal body-associated FliL family protein [Curvibacter sp. RS43]|uniref:Flagellar protein FliL n=1 Tax=Curvibacter microcysteis TaxID=3026419 RepID=A0ABT5ML49_9BURK|nr:MULTISPECIES: flagellar basal body-associated FliL family protein [unclassified Curvibacter]MDD0811834.1 flagellar basal body-associated FliL family protein [Curvibacter sp. RS43]MDD0816599.1 flagellar basal body-associated FliL family protein [Curvibacter sp. HBC28]